MEKKAWEINQGERKPGSCVEHQFFRADWVVLSFHTTEPQRGEETGASKLIVDQQHRAELSPREKNRESAMTSRSQPREDEAESLKIL